MELLCFFLFFKLTNLGHFLICFIALTIIRLLQYKILKNENKSTLNVDGWEQGITAEKIKKTLQEYQCSIDKNGVCLITGVKEELIKIFDAFEVKYEIMLQNTISKKKSLKLFSIKSFRDFFIFKTDKLGSSI